jgi:glycosyltransferase involved in cell wall biosynthesis
MPHISILHPFTPGAAGVIESGVPTYHAQPHLKALENYVHYTGSKGTMEYFTPKLWGYAVYGKYVTWNFYPVSWKINGDHKKWLKQSSASCWYKYKRECPDVTIINTSGHASPFCFELACLIRRQKKNYIAMFGGHHYSDDKFRREYFRNAHHLLVHTRAQKREMELMPLFGNTDIRVIPLGVDCSLFKPVAIGRPEKGPNLLFVGRITELKQIHLAIESVLKLHQAGFKDTRLKVIGPIVSETYYKSLIKRINDFGLQQSIEFLGHKSHQDLISFYNESDMLLLPSSSESFGMVMIESMACGVPVAAIKGSGGPDEIVLSGYNGLLSNEGIYSEEIVKIFQDRELLGEWSRNAREWALANYSIDATSKALKSSMDDCLIYAGY